MSLTRAAKMGLPDRFYSVWYGYRAGEPRYVVLWDENLRPVRGTLEMLESHEAATVRARELNELHGINMYRLDTIPVDTRLRAYLLSVSDDESIQERP